VSDLRTWLVAYDITDDRRRTRVHRLASEIGLPLQYSLFAASLGAREVNAAVRDIARLIDHRRDDVRLYPIRGTQAIDLLGRPQLQDGLIWLPESARRD
jgi:CRISPR-associated protein Cas2